MPISTANWANDSFQITLGETRHDNQWDAARGNQWGLAPLKNRVPVTDTRMATAREVVALRAAVFFWGTSS